jgi:hypothetical protein
MFNIFKNELIVSLELTKISYKAKKKYNTTYTSNRLVYLLWNINKKKKAGEDKS